MPIGLVISDPFSRFIQTMLPAAAIDDIIVVDDGTPTWAFARCIDEGLAPNALGPADRRIGALGVSGRAAACRRARPGR